MAVNPSFPGRFLLPLLNRVATLGPRPGFLAKSSLTPSCSSSGSRHRITHAQSVQRTRSIHTTTALFCNKNSNRGLSRHANEAVVTDDGEPTHDEGPLMTDLRKRGLYPNQRYGHYHKYKVENFSISEDRKNVTIVWNDGHTSEFDAIWLRHNCHCQECKHETNGMIKVEWNSLPLDITLLSVTMEGDKLAVFRWGTPDGNQLHHGVIPTAALRCYCYSNKAIADRRKTREMTFYKDKSIPEIEYEEFQSSDRGVHKCVTHVNDKGLCIVKNVPKDKESFKKTIRLIAPIQETMYGETFEVVSTRNAINAAYTSSRLPLHMDLTHYERPPGLQILHCLRFDQDIIGGANTLLDIHEVAHTFRREHPELFDRLTRLPLTFDCIHYNWETPVHMETQTPMFSLNHFGELVAVTYHPMLQGPVELPKDDMMPFYEAYTEFFKTVSEHESIYRFHFEAGDFLIFNNRRILHGRDEFTGSGRHLLGCYVELSDFHSRVQALHNKYGNGRLASRSGSQNWF